MSQSCGMCPCLEDIDKGQQGGYCCLSGRFMKFVNICDQEFERMLYLDEGSTPKKCTKSKHNYSFFIKCTCGFEASIEAFYWNRFKLCLGCGATCEEEKSNV